MQTRILSIFKLSCFVFCLVGCGQRSPNSAEPHIVDGSTKGQNSGVASRESAASSDSHQRMILELAKLDAQALENNEYFNGEMLAQADRARLEQAIKDNDLVNQLELNRSIGVYEMNSGKSASAAEHLARACELIPEVIERRLARIRPESQESLYLQAGVAYLRLAEDQNCVMCTDGEACILPIRGTGVHQHRRGSENAMKYFRLATEVNPRNAIAVWLWNVAAMTLGEHPDALPKEYQISSDRFVSANEFPAFTNIAQHLGLDTLSHSGGVVADDFDGDGWIDLVVSDWSPRGQLRFFHNQGNGSFNDATERANLMGITGGLNLVHADYDNDGDLDLYVLRGAWLGSDVGSQPNSLLQNDGSGRFVDVTYDVGLGQSHHPTQTAGWADYDNDGDLDLYVGNEKTRCQLFRNDDGFFVDVAQPSGVANQHGYAKAVCWGDFNSDRWPDLYVSNLGQNNRLYLNQQDGTFRDLAKELNVVRPIDSFACWFWDYNNDGRLDLFVGSYTVGVQYVGMEFLGAGRVTEPDRLYQGVDNGKFKDVGQEKGLVAVTQPMGCNFGDLDNDGFLDFYLGTGYPGYDGLMPNVMYRNRKGELFEDVTYAGRFGHLQKGHGVAFVDLDHDGDQDVFVELGGAYQGDSFHNALFENPGFKNHWIKISLVGTQSNRSAIGARVRLDISDDSGSRSIHRWVTSGSSFGGNSLRLEIGLGDAKRIDRLVVNWPTTDTTQTFENLGVDQLIEITEGKDALQNKQLTAIQFKVD